MIFFTLSQSITIKLADGTVIKYNEEKNQNEISSVNVYCASFDELQSIKNFLKKRKKNKIKIIQEDLVKAYKSFPRELGIKNKEYNLLDSKNLLLKFSEDKSFFLNETFQNLSAELASKKEGIKVLLFSGLGRNIGEMISAFPALKILSFYLNKKYKVLRFDACLEASDNTFYFRDKQILSTQNYINDIFPMACSMKKILEYDFYFDMGSLDKLAFYKSLGFVDTYLHKFGFDYKKIPDKFKQNEINIASYKPENRLKELLEKEKKHSKLLLFHPFSADGARSMSQAGASVLLKKLLKQNLDFKIFTILNIGTFKDKEVLNLEKFSKSAFDFFYLISQADAIVCVDTATYHIAEGFLIPSLVFFTDKDYEKRIKYYNFTEPYYLKPSLKNFARTNYDDGTFSLAKLDMWNNIKIKKILNFLRLNT